MKCDKRDPADQEKLVAAVERRVRELSRMPLRDWPSDGFIKTCAWTRHGREAGIEFEVSDCLILTWRVRSLRPVEMPPIYGGKTAFLRHVLWDVGNWRRSPLQRTRQREER